MGTAPRPCSFCGRPSWFGPFDGAFVCEGCPRRIGALAYHAAASAIASIWALTGSPARHDKADAPPRLPDVDFEELFRRFKEGVAGMISPDDTQSHVDLAQAYAEMGLGSDALRSAAIALDRGTSPDVIGLALGVVLTAPLLRSGGLEELKRRLRR